MLPINPGRFSYHLHFTNVETEGNLRSVTRKWQSWLAQDARALGCRGGTPQTSRLGLTPASLPPRSERPWLWPRWPGLLLHRPEPLPALLGPPPPASWGSGALKDMKHGRPTQSWSLSLFPRVDTPCGKGWRGGGVQKSDNIPLLPFFVCKKVVKICCWRGV